jgi:hypothetical protein
LTVSSSAPKQRDDGNGGDARLLDLPHERGPGELAIRTQERFRRLDGHATEKAQQPVGLPEEVVCVASHIFEKVRQRPLAPGLGATQRRPLQRFEQRRVDRRIGEAAYADATAFELPFGAEHQPGAGRIQPPDARAVQLDFVEFAFELAQLLVQRRGFVGDPVPAEDKTQNVLAPLGPVPGVRFGTADVAQWKAPFEADVTR